jgi:hypothetical protein
MKHKALYLYFKILRVKKKKNINKIQTKNKTKYNLNNDRIISLKDKSMLISLTGLITQSL